MEHHTKKEISRRDFFKIAGSAGLASAGLTACNDRRESTNTAVQTVLGEMTYRTNPNTGDKVSLLGYGCMRWPTLPGGDEPMDQETINSLVDYALEHGVNYFDTSPALLQRTFGTRHGNCPRTPSSQSILHSHKTIKFFTFHMEP